MPATIAGRADTALTRPTVAPMLEFFVLGPVEVRRDGSPVAIPRGKTAELLVHLALAAGAPVRADRLLDDLWAGTPTNRNTLQQKVARLRRSLDEPSLLAGGDDGYRLEIEPDAVDAHRVLRDVDSATALFDDGDYAAAAAAGAAALALFRGDVLPSAGDWAAPQRARLEEARMQLMETCFAARLRLGEDVIGELDAVVATAPYREELWELLITALYRGGRQADALAAYQRVRGRLDGRTRPGARAATQGDRAADPDPGSVARRARGQPAVACSRARGARWRDRGTARAFGGSPPCRGRRPRRYRQDRRRDRDGTHARRGPRLARPARGSADRGRRARHGRRRGRHRRRRGGATGALAPDGDGADPRQLRACGRCRRGARGAPARCGSDAAGSLHQSGTARARARRPCSSSLR